ncbi:MAG: alpha-L-arabinofuranosidase C-terminal domain-containing protein [Nibricoccus sp.]
MGSAALIVCILASALAAEVVTVSVDVEATGRPISRNLVGIFFEDINYAADGGLYAELVQNRSFEYQATEQMTWNPMTSWEVVQRGEAKVTVMIDAADPLHTNNPKYAVLRVGAVGAGAGIANGGFGGMALTGGERYDVSLFAKHLYHGDRWGKTANEGDAFPLIVRFESADGENLGEAQLEAPMPKRTWQRLSATITAKRTEPTARLLVLATQPGGVAVDVVSVFPQKTFRGRKNGLRADLAQAIADLNPKFMRFPGGCLVHGNGLGNMYRWKDTIGPIEQRRGQENLWRYHQTVGLGYFEYFQFCEDIGAAPLPVVPAGVCCQNSAYSNGLGQQGLPLDQMSAYIQDVLDLIEYTNGSATSTWGAKRAAAGHSEPFGLKYLGVGNEDRITPVFRERFEMIYKAVKAKHPEIVVVGTVGPSHQGWDFEAGWKIADELKLPMVDEHYYVEPEWFLANTRRYDSYDRKKSKVYLGEWASRGNKLTNALAEAAYLTGLERNSDVVTMASYAPLLAKIGNTQWNPDLIYFSNTEVFPTVNYYVQQLFSLNAGDEWLEPVVSGGGSANAVEWEKRGLAVSAVRDSASGDVIVKIVNASAEGRSVQVRLARAGRLSKQVVRTVLTGDQAAVNDAKTPRAVVPVTEVIGMSDDGKGGGVAAIASAAHSLTVVRIQAKP